MYRGEGRVKLDVHGQEGKKILDVNKQEGGGSWKLDSFHGRRMYISLRWKNTQKISNTCQNICRKNNFVLAKVVFIYWQNISFRPIKKRKLLEKNSLRYNVLCLITNVPVLKFHIDHIADQCGFRMMIFGRKKFILFIYLYIFIVFY